MSEYYSLNVLLHVGQNILNKIATTSIITDMMNMEPVVKSVSAGELKNVCKKPNILTQTVSKYLLSKLLNSLKCICNCEPSDVHNNVTICAYDLYRYVSFCLEHNSIFVIPVFD
jgi:hypothetical protein